MSTPKPPVLLNGSSRAVHEDYLDQLRHARHLCADQQPRNLIAVEAALASTNYHVFTAQSGLDALGLVLVQTGTVSSPIPRRDVTERDFAQAAVRSSSLEIDRARAAADLSAGASRSRVKPRRALTA
jgi:hypothetical protein